MRIGVIGINHKSASLELREAVARATSKMAADFTAVFLSTCNRTEIYFSEDNLVEAHSLILRELQRQMGIPFEHALYSYFGGDCFFHLAAVTAGLDSVIQGESEIQRQVKESYLATTGNLPSVLHFLFQKSLKLGKEMRTRFPIFSRSSNLEGTVVEIASHFFSDLSSLNLLLVGNSEINRKVIRRLSGRVGRMVLATKVPQAAESFALDHGVVVADATAIDAWSAYDWVVSGTDSHDYLIRPSRGEVHTRLILDLSMPRTVDPSLGRYPFLNLFNVEQIGKLVENRKETLQREIEEVRRAILEGVEKQIELYQRRSVCAYSYC